MICFSFSLLFLLSVGHILEQILPTSLGYGSSMSSINNIGQEHSVRPLSQRKSLLTSTDRDPMGGTDTR